MEETPGQVLTVPAVVGNLAIWADPPCKVNARTVFWPKGKAGLDAVVYAAIGGLSLATTEVSEECRAIYLDRVQGRFTAARIVMDVLAVSKKPDWGEVAILTGTPVLCNGPSLLTVLKAADATVAWGAVGPTFIDLDLSANPIEPGDHVWLGWSSKFGAGDAYAFRAFLPDDILSGLSVSYSGLRPTTAVGGYNFNRLGSAVRTAHSCVGCS